MEAVSERLPADKIIDDVDTKVIAAALGEENIESAVFSSSDDKGINFCGSLQRLTVRISGQASPLRLIVKRPPENKELREALGALGMFTRERQVYELFSDAVSRLLGPDVPVSIVPRYYGSPLPDTLLLQDLSAESFKMIERGRQLDAEHSSVAVKLLARLHAVSVAVSRTDPTVATDYSEVLFTEEARDAVAGFVKPNWQATIKAVEGWQGYERFVEKLRSMEEEIIDRAIKVVQPKEGELLVLNHGDYWVNNILFKYDSEGKVLEGRTIDFQLSRFSSPVIDMNYYLYTSVHSEVDHGQLWRQYAEELNKSLTEFGVVDVSVNADELQKLADERIVFALIGACTDLASVVAEPGITVELNELNDTDRMQRLYNSQRYKDAFSAVLLKLESKGLF